MNKECGQTADKKGNKKELKFRLYQSCGGRELYRSCGRGCGAELSPPKVGAKIQFFFDFVGLSSIFLFAIAKAGMV